MSRHLNIDICGELARLRARVRELETALAKRAPAGRAPDAIDQRLEDFAAAGNGWFWETDADLRFIYMSDSVFAITGVRPEWHYGKTRAEIGSPASLSAHEWAAHLALLERREPFTDFVFQREGPDGMKWLRTSGRPVYDAEGRFKGYRGSATDVTAEIVAQSHSRQLMAAIERLDELFVLWNADDRLVVCNRRFREINAEVVETTEPGTTFEAHIRAAIAAGLYPDADADPDGWFADRLARHRNPGEPFEQERQDGRWLLISEQRLTNGCTATISADITGRKQTEQDLQRQHDILATALNTIPDGVQVLDKDLKLVAWNDRLFEVLKLERDAILGAEDPGKAFRYALAGRGEYGPGDIDDLVASREEIARSPVPVKYERQMVTGNWIECRGNPLEGGGYLAIYRDIDDAKKMYERLELLASVDALTELPNRRSFFEAAKAEFLRARRHGRELSFLILDIDHFKSINDRFGHAAGDEALRRVANCCRQSLRRSDHIGRIGGEEFAVMLPETGPDLGYEAAERLRLALSKLEIPTEEEVLWLTVSIGGMTATQTHDSAEQVMAEADAALYDAKHGGRNRVVFRR